VVAIYTEADLAADGIGNLPCVAAIECSEKLIVPPRPALAKDVVRHVGDPVACVIAESIEAAIEAAEAIEVDYTPLPCVVDGAAALAAEAPQLWPQVPGNSAYLYHRGDKAAVDKAMASAQHIVTADLLNNRVVVAPLETRAAIATYDAAQDLLHLTLTGQAVHGIRRQLADSIFRIPQDRLR
jgi:carbon-monoxide dehydrogenase large subunit